MPGGDELPRAGSCRQPDGSAAGAPSHQQGSNNVLYLIIAMSYTAFLNVTGCTSLPNPARPGRCLWQAGAVDLLHGFSAALCSGAPCPAEGAVVSPPQFLPRSRWPQVYKGVSLALFAVSKRRGAQHGRDGPSSHGRCLHGAPRPPVSS